MDRFEEIKRIAQSDRHLPSTVDATSALEAMDWLIAEVERLRKIEDACIATRREGSPDPYYDPGPGLVAIMNVLNTNPRPKSED